MNSSAVKSEQHESQPRRSLLLDGRIVMRVVILLAAVYAAYSLGRVAAGWRSVPDARAAVQALDEDTVGFAPPMPLAGRWSFSDVEWDFRSTPIEQQDISTHFERLATVTTGSPEPDEEYAELGARLVKLANDVGLTPEKRSGNEVYVWDQATMKAQLVVRRDADRVWPLSFAVVHMGGENKWHLAQFSPRNEEARLNVAAGHLLPLPTGAKREGGRFTDHGDLLLEFVTVEATTAEALKRSWAAAGFETRPTGYRDGEGFSYLCRQGTDVIYAWSPDEVDAVRSMMLVRCPGGSDTNSEPHHRHSAL